jgi:PAS domain S-box-containing protein
VGNLLHVLIVEDSEDDSFLLIRQLKQGGYDPTYERVETPGSLVESLNRQTWDIVISDYAMPRFSGLDALRIVKEQHPELPFILVSGTIGEDTAVAAMRAGAQDYIMKSNLTRLAPAVERELQEAQVRRARQQAEIELRRSDERFRLTIEGIHDYAIFMLGPDGRIISWNEGAERVFGYQVSEIIGQHLARFYSREDRDNNRPINAMRSAAEEGRFEDEGWRCRKDGTQFWAESVITPLRDDNGNIRGYVEVARDITERKRAQEEIKRQVEQLGALRAIEKAIVSSLDLQVTLNVILDQVTAQLQVDATDVLLLNRSSQTLEHSASRGFRSKSITRSRVHLGEDYAGRAALERQLVHVGDLSQVDDPSVRFKELATEDFTAYFAAPLIAKGEVKGILEIFHRTPLDTNRWWLEFLHALVGQAAIAIDNASLFDQVQRSNLELTHAYDATIEGWSRALDLRDRETEGHTRRVTESSEQLARLMGLSAVELEHLRRGALLHDIGKMGIPDRILLKPGRLDAEEWAVMRLHPTYAYEWLSPIGYLAPSLDIPYCHHEKWNGSGYPRGLGGADIPLAARIFTIVDVWDALTSDRPYRKAWPKAQVRRYVREQTNTQFDPKVVEAFLDSKIGGNGHP